MKRITKVLIIGREAHVVSCADGVDTSSAEAIVEAIAHGHVKLIGTGLVVGDKITQTVDTNGKPMHFPNRAGRLTLLDVEKRRSFAKLFDIMPAPLKAMSSNSEWHEENIVIDCFNCHSPIPGKRRVKGAMTQIFRPDSKLVTHIGKKWYCGCTTKPPIAKHADVLAKKASKKDSLWPRLKGGVALSDEKVTLTITVTPEMAIKIMTLMVK